MFSKSQIILAFALLASNAVFAQDALLYYSTETKDYKSYQTISSSTVEYVQPTGYETTTSKTDSYRATATVNDVSGAHQIGIFAAFIAPLFAL